MRNISSGFKEAIKKLGREIDVKITYNNNVIETNKIFRVDYSYEAQVLKSVMKKVELSLATTYNFSNGDILNLQIGVKVNGSFEYIDYGNFVVYSSELSEDNKSRKYVCYDKMLYFMVDYTKDNFNFTFPMTIAEYITALCNTVEITPPSSYENVANATKELTEDMYLDSEGKPLGYTARDVMDQLAEVIGRVIYVDENDQLILKVRTITNDVIDESYLKEDKVDFGEEFGPFTKTILSRSGGADKIYQTYGIIPVAPERAIEITDNQIMNGNDRSDYLDELVIANYNIFNWLVYEGGGGGSLPLPTRKYFNYCDVMSTGILYYDIFDVFSVRTSSGTYNCVMMNNEITIEQGIEEHFYSEKSKEEEQDYKKMDSTDRRINQAYLIVNKQKGEITGLVSNVEEYKTLNDERVLQVEKRTNSVETKMDSTELTIKTMETNIKNAQETTINSMVTINVNGINVSTNASAISTLINNERFIVKNGDTPLAFFGYDSEDQTTKSYVEHLTVNTYFIAGHHRVEKININGEDRTGWFYIGG
jgi:hypothetical protein